ncbi:GerAB/ArcD/ProY family transporter [Paenibacillus tarimensis]
MIDGNRTIGILPLFYILILSIGIVNHVMVIPLLLETAYRDAWLSVLMFIPPLLLWVGILIFIMRKTGQQKLTLWVNDRCGPLAAELFRIIAIAVVFTMGFASLRDASNWTVGSYLPQTPLLVITLALAGLSAAAAAAGLRSIAVTAGVSGNGQHGPLKGKIDVSLSVTVTRAA